MRRAGESISGAAEFLLAAAENPSGYRQIQFVRS
jgi:hypothetical protein